MDDLQFDIFRLSQSCKSVVNLCFANLGTKSTKSNAIGTAIPIQVNDSFFKKIWTKHGLFLFIFVLLTMQIQI